MSEIRWELYPFVATLVRPRAWLELQSHLQLAPTTLDAYGRSLNDFLTFCRQRDYRPCPDTCSGVTPFYNDLASSGSCPVGDYTTAHP